VRLRCHRPLCASPVTVLFDGEAHCSLHSNLLGDEPWKRYVVGSIAAATPPARAVAVRAGRATPDASVSVREPVPQSSAVAS
jgi:hypothetical protein